MKNMVIWQIACVLYAKVLRHLLVKTIEDPDTEWDDVILRITDSIFDFGR